MDFPEVWQLKVKQQSVKPETYSSSDSVAMKLTSKLPVIRMVSILLPEADTTKLIRILNDSDYYSSDSFKIADVLTKNFIDGFLKTGKFYCSMTEPSSFSDCFSILNNKLVIRLHKTSIYSTNTVEFCKFQSKHLSDDEMKVYEINLLQKKLEIAKLREELKTLIKDSSVNFMWTPNSDEFCPSSIAKYFTDTGHSVKLMKNKQLERPEYGLKFPTISDEFSYPEVAEYIGMILLGCNVEETDFSSYRIPDDHEEVGRGKVIHCKGFIVPKTIQNIIDEARKLLVQNLSFPWIALSLIIPEKPSKILVITHDTIYSL